MSKDTIEMLVAAVVDYIGDSSSARDLSYATWRETRHKDDFNPKLTNRYLRSEGCEVNEQLLHTYSEIHHHYHSPVLLTNITKQAPWIDCVDQAFVNYDSFESLRTNPKYVEIFTFTTPAFTNDRRIAFFELWAEDGRYSQMGSWWWVQMRLSDSGWKVDWKSMFAIS